jgi:hypothetical protein
MNAKYTNQMNTFIKMNANNLTDAELRLSFQRNFGNNANGSESPDEHDVRRSNGMDISDLGAGPIVFEPFQDWTFQSQLTFSPPSWRAKGTPRKIMITKIGTPSPPV